MTLDEKLKARAQREGCPTPKGFDERMDALLYDLPEQVTPIKKRRVPRTAACIGIAAALVVGAAAAAPTVLEMAQGVIGYFAQNSGSQYAEYQGKYEKYNAAVGISDTNGDQTLTIDNLAVDDSYMLVFYTLKSKTPLELVGTDDEPQSWRASWTAPSFFAQVNGKQLDTTGAIENEATMPDAYTLTGVHRIVLKDALPDQFDLVLYDGGSSDINDANFQFAMSVDKSAVAVETLTVEPKQDFTVEYDYTDEDGKTNTIRCTPRIERVSISPFGSTITLSEWAEAPMTNFVLRDDKGNYLPIISNGFVGSSIGRASNSFELLGAGMDTKSVTLIPCIGPEGSHPISGALDSLPLTDDSSVGYTLESLDIGERRAVATFSSRGPITISNIEFWLLTADGTPLDHLTDCFMDFRYDRENSLCITTVEYPQATDAQVAQIAGVSFMQPDDDLKLLEDQAVTINLQ